MRENATTTSDPGLQSRRKLSHQSRIDPVSNTFVDICDCWRGSRSGHCTWLLPMLLEISQSNHNPQVPAAQSSPTRHRLELTIQAQK